MSSPGKWGESKRCQAWPLLGASSRLPPGSLSQAFRTKASHPQLRWEPSQSWWEGLEVNHREMHSLSSQGHLHTLAFNHRTKTPCEMKCKKEKEKKRHWHAAQQLARSHTQSSATSRGVASWWATTLAVAGA